MVETITPVVHGGRRTSYVTSVALHTTGAGAGAAVLGAALGGIGAALGAPYGGAGLMVLAVVATLYLVREAGRVPIPLPQARRQVPEWWRSFFSPPVAATLYGVGLGIAFATFISFGTFVAVAAAAFLSGHPLVGAALAAPFGVARGLSVLVSVRATGAQGATPVVHRLEDVAASGWPRAVNAVALALVAAAAVASL